MGSEFSGNEDEAKKYYKQILVNFSKHFNAAKAEGAIRRLDSVGQKLELVGPLLSNPAQQLNAASLSGKIVVVYYWATYSTQATGDFAMLAKLQQTFAKDVAIITVSLDDAPKEPASFVNRAGPPGLSPAPDRQGRRRPQQPARQPLPASPVCRTCSWSAPTARSSATRSSSAPSKRRSTSSSRRRKPPA